MTLKPTTLFASCCTALLVLAACGTQTVGSRYVKSENVTVSQGKVIAVSDKDSALLAGTSLEIPSGALSQDTVITLEVGIDNLVDTDDVAGPVAIWGPAGTRFSKPARMTLPLTVNESGDEIAILVREADGTESELPSSAVTIDAQGRAVFEVSGFTSFQPLRRRACQTNATCGPRQVCRAGRCVRPTSCTANSACPTGQVCVNGTCNGGMACSPVVCTLACQYGFARDPATGCEVCSCNPAPALDGGPMVCTADAFQCPDGTFVGRSGPDCRFVCPASDAGVCSPVVCTLACQYGFARDPATGCEVCSCNPAPALDGGMACTPVVCTLACQYGFARDPATGCEVCSCNPAPALDGGMACTPVVCTLACQYGFARDPATGCEVCSCNPAPSLDGGMGP
jgi:hypothetical protein